MENNARLIAVERDSEGIRLAALEMLTETLYVEDRKRCEQIAAHCADPEAVLAAAAPKRAFACGYYVWVTYLFTLEAQMQAGIPAELDAADAIGLLALRRARQQFESEYPFCRCGRRMRDIGEKAKGVCRQCEGQN